MAALSRVCRASGLDADRPEAATVLLDPQAGALQCALPGQLPPLYRQGIGPNPDSR